VGAGGAMQAQPSCPCCHRGGGGVCWVCGGSPRGGGRGKQVGEGCAGDRKAGGSERGKEAEVCKYLER
jgi:hypothetical protein